MTQDDVIGEKVIQFRKTGLKFKQNSVNFVPDVTEYGTYYLYAFCVWF